MKGRERENKNTAKETSRQISVGCRELVRKQDRKSWGAREIKKHRSEFMSEKIESKIYRNR